MALRSYRTMTVPGPNFNEKTPPYLSPNSLNLSPWGFSKARAALINSLGGRGCLLLAQPTQWDQMEVAQNRDCRRSWRIPFVAAAHLEQTVKAVDQNDTDSYGGNGQRALRGFDDYFFHLGC